MSNLLLRVVIPVVQIRVDVLIVVCFSLVILPSLWPRAGLACSEEAKALALSMKVRQPFWPFSSVPHFLIDQQLVYASFERSQKVEDSEGYATTKVGSGPVDLSQ